MSGGRTTPRDKGVKAVVVSGVPGSEGDMDSGPGSVIGTRREVHREGCVRDI